MEHRSLKTVERLLEALVKKAQEGDADSFSKIYEQFVTPIYRYIYYRVRFSEVEDLTEQVFLKAWENIRQYRPQNYSFSAWIFRIAHNVVVDYYRLARPNGELSHDLPDESRAGDALSLVRHSLDQKNLRKAILKLKENFRQILLLRYINDLSYREISEILDKSEAAVRLLQFRALRALKQTLREMGISEGGF